MIIFTYLLDMAIVNAFTLYKQNTKLSDGYVDVDFKRDVCEDLVKQYIDMKINQQ